MRPMTLFLISLLVLTVGWSLINRYFVEEFGQLASPLEDRRLRGTYAYCDIDPIYREKLSGFHFEMPIDNIPAQNFELVEGMVQHNSTIKDSTKLLTPTCYERQEQTLVPERKEPFVQLHPFTEADKMRSLGFNLHEATEEINSFGVRTSELDLEANRINKKTTYPRL